MKKTQRGVEVNKVHIEIDELELSLSKNPKELNGLLRLMNLYIDDGKLTRCKTYFESLKRLTSTTRLNYTQGMSIIDIYLRYWKAEKYAPVLSSSIMGMNEGGGGSSIRLNISSERSNYLHDISSIMESILKTAEGSRSHLLLSRRAYVLECMGEFQTSLAALSELISIQANDGVDLSYVIFKAAIMLHHIGQLKQSVEYLEFILDDPPTHDGYSRSHVFAYLTLVYEQSGDIYKSLVSKSYDNLLDALSIDMPNNKAIVTNNKKQFSQQSDIWESLAVQAVDRCEYVLAMGFLTQAINKASNKAKLLHLLAEVYVSTKQNTLALLHAENAYSLNNQSVELRNLLLQLSPDKWGDSLRSMAPSRASTAIGDDDFDNLDDEMSLKDLYKSANPKTKNNKKVVESPARQEATKKMKSVKDRATKHQSAAIVETTPTALTDNSSSNVINATHGVNTDSISMEKELCAVVVDSTVDSAEGKSSNDILTTESERHMEDEVREINDASDNNETVDVVIVPDPSVTATMQHEPIQDDVVAITTITSTATTTTSEATAIPLPVLEEPKMSDTSHNELLIGMPAMSSNSPSPLTTTTTAITTTTTTAMLQANNQPLTSEQMISDRRNDDASSPRSTSSPPDSWFSRGFKSLSFKSKSANKKREINSNDRDASPNDMSNSNSRNISIGSSSRPSTVKEQEGRKEVSDSIFQASTVVPVSNRQSVTPTIVRSPSKKPVPLQTSLLSKKNNTEQNRSFFGSIFSSKNKDDLKALNDVADDNDKEEEDNNDDNSNDKRYDNTNRMKSSRKMQSSHNRAQSPLHNSSALSKPVLNASERRILNKVLSGNTNVS